MGIPTLIGSAHTPSNASSVDITSGIDSTYDEYMFVFTDINPATDAQNFQFQVNVDGQSGFNETITSTAFYAQHREMMHLMRLPFMGVLTKQKVLLIKI